MLGRPDAAALASAIGTELRAKGEEEALIGFTDALARARAPPSRTGACIASGTSS